MRQWIIDHDDSWLFVIAYIGLAVVLSIWISLFWLIAVVAVHGMLEWVRQRHDDSEIRGVLARVLWELKLDIALVLFALVVTVYMEIVLGIAGLSGAARIGLAGGARFAGWQKVIRGVLLSLDDAAQLGRAALRRGNGGESVADGAVEDRSIWGGWTGQWAIGDWLSLFLGIASAGLLLMCPWITDHTFASMLSEIAQELHPFPPADL